MNEKGKANSINKLCSPFSQADFRGKSAFCAEIGTNCRMARPKRIQVKLTSHRCTVTRRALVGWYIKIGVFCDGVLSILLIPVSRLDSVVERKRERMWVWIAIHLSSWTFPIQYKRFSFPLVGGDSREFTFCVLQLGGFGSRKCRSWLSRCLRR